MRKPDRIERHDRTVQAIWETGESYREGEEVKTPLLTLTASHYKGSKAFGAILRPEVGTVLTLPGGSVITGREFMLFDENAERIAVERVARYSAKRLEEFFQKALATVMEREEVAA